MQNIKIATIIVGLFLIVNSAFAQSGLEIMEKAERKLFSYDTSVSEGLMVLSRDNREIARRELLVRQIETDKIDEGRIDIMSPSSLRDTRLISESGIGGSKQWVYTPRTGRFRRISDRGRSSPFVASDFTYENINRWQLSDYIYDVIERSASCNAGQCIKIEGTPTLIYSEYSKLHFYVDSSNRLRQVDYFDKRERLQKTLVHSQFRNYLGNTLSYPSSSEMINHLTNTSTILSRSSLKFNVSITPSIFDRD